MPYTLVKLPAIGRGKSDHFKLIAGDRDLVRYDIFETFTDPAGTRSGADGTEAISTVDSDRDLFAAVNTDESFPVVRRGIGLTQNGLLS